MKNATDITIILDRSGSMQNLRAETVTNLNQFIADQQKVEGECHFTLVQFDDRYEYSFSKNLKDVTPLTLEDYQPRGWTALLDAVGRTINETGRRLKMLPDDARPEKILMVILTDGQENWSKTYSFKEIKAKVEHQQNKYSWAFVFLGAGLDAFAQGAQIGTMSANTVQFDANPIAYGNTYTLLSAKAASFRAENASLPQAMSHLNWNANDRKMAVETKDDSADPVTTSTTSSIP